MTALEVKIALYIINSDKDLLDAGCLWHVYDYLGGNEAGKEKLTLEHLLCINNADEYFYSIVTALNTLDAKSQTETLSIVKTLFVSAMRNAELPGFKPVIKNKFNAFIQQLSGEVGGNMYID